MGKTILEITMSLDGIIAGPDITREQPMGLDGIRLHDWMFDAKTAVDARLLQELAEKYGAVIVGGRTYAIAIDDAWGGITPFDVPAFVVSSQVPAHVVSGFTFVPDGIASALSQARAAAGAKNVWVMGGAATARQYLQAGLLDELHIHIAPLLMGEGTHLFDSSSIPGIISLENLEAITTPGAFHLKFRVVR